MARLRRPLARLVIAQCVLFTALACTDTSCDCITPLEVPMGEEPKVYDAVQARLTSHAIGFLEDNIPNLIDMFLGEGGLEFEVSAMNEEFCAPPFDWPCFSLDICQNGCTISIAIADATLTLTPPNVIHLDAWLDIQGVVDIRNDLDCDVSIDVQSKHVSGDIHLLLDTEDNLVFFQLGGLNVSIANDDYDLDCSWWIDWLMELLKGIITDQLNNAVGDQLDGALDDALVDIVCLACDFYSGGCPPGSACDGNFCQQGGNCRVNPLGIVGTIDVGELLADVSPGLEAKLDLFLATGQQQDTSIDGVVLADALDLRLIGGVDTARNQCVPEPDPAEIPPNAAPPRMPFSDTVPGTVDPYMAGIAISDVFLDWFMYKAHLSGLLCLSLGTDTTDLLTSSTISLLGMGSLNTLTTGRNVPIQLSMRPNHVPYIEVGAGLLGEDEEGNTIIEVPLLYVFVPGMSLDFYVLIDEHWTRIVTVTLDLQLDVALDLTPDNELVVLFGEESIHLDNVVVTNYELLAEEPETIANLIPTLVSMALPLLTDVLDPIEIPDLEGFVLIVQAIQGDLPRTGTDYFEYLGLYANLELAPPPPPARDTTARIAEVRVPDLHLMSLARPDGPMYPEVVIDVGAGGEPAEYSFRVDGGFWRPFSRVTRLRVHDPRLLLVGKHVVEVRARTPGDYRSLDPTPARVEFDIRPPGEAHENFKLPPVDWGPAEHVEGSAPLLMPVEDQDDPLEDKLGCACAHTNRAASGLAFLLLALALLIRRKYARISSFLV